MRFDDSLRTVLAADTSTPAGAGAMWRQLVDLLARERVPADEAAIGRLRALRDTVPVEIRSGSARALAFATPPASLVSLFAEDELAVAAPVLRTATLSGGAWTAMMPGLSPVQRAILRSRRDLPTAAEQALAAFGSVDFLLGDHSPATAEAEPAAASAAGAAAAVPDAPLSPSPFVALGDVARGLPLVAEALRQVEVEVEPAPAQPAGTFAIADLVRRIDAFNQRRADASPAAPAERVAEAAPADGFRYATDAAGVVTWVDGVARQPLVGANLALGGGQGVVEIDASVPGAVSRRARFADARLSIGGRSDAAGAWRLSGLPAFDRGTGRFTGYHGSARRPRADEEAGPHHKQRQAASDSLRQLVHELRTPATAIAGFAELIDSQLLGPVSDPYRAQAQAIRTHAAGLVCAIEDLDTAARIEGGALELRAGHVAVLPLVERAIATHAALSALRGVTPTIKVSGDVPAIAADDRAAERLVDRLLATLIAAAIPGERLRVSIKPGETRVSLRFDRPAALPDGNGAALLSLDGAEEGEGAPLLGTSFALRLARNLAAEMGGSLSIDSDRLTLRLPAAVDREMELATTV